MKLADYVAEFLSKHVDHIFVGNGGCIITQLDSVERHSGIKNIPCQNEQGASIAAEAYARIHGFGAAIATSGPGMANLIQGIACAWFDSIPVLYISGTPPTNHLKNGSKVKQKGFQEMDVVDMVKPITKYAVLLKKPEDIRYELEKLVYIAKEGCKGPVLLDLPDDLQREEVNPLTMRRFVISPETYVKDESITRIKEKIENSNRPVVVVGGGVKISNSEQLMKEWLKSTKLPFVTTWSTIDLFPENEWPNLIGNFGISSNRYGNWAIQNSDLIISFASRLDTHQTGSDPSKFAPNAYKICINIDNYEFYKNDMIVDLPVFDDVNDILKELNCIHMNYPNIDKWKERIAEWKQKYPVCIPEYYEQKNSVNPYVFMDELSKLTKDGDIVITDAGATLTWTMQAYKMRHKQKLFSAFNHSPMGYALPASIGAYYASNSQVICITGDGGLMMNLQELQTVVHNKLPIKIFLINNGEYGIIKQTQDTWMDGRYTASDPNSGVGFPHWNKMCTGFGIPYTFIDGRDYDRMISKIEMVLNTPGVILCDINIKSGEQILPKLVFGHGIEDMAPLIPRKEFKEIMNNDNN